jgi:hypothetical protein
VAAAVSTPKTPTVYAFTCEVKVAPFIRTSGISAVGGLRWTWAGAGAGPMTTECGYHCHTEAQLLAHLVVTHRIQISRARQMAEVMA